MFYKIAELSIASNDSTTRNSDVFIAKPSAEKERLAGKLFILIEIDSKSKEVEKIINFLTNEINICYYQNEKILFREKLRDLKIEHIFEASLTKVNKKVSDFFTSEKINISIDKINISVGIINDNDIYFANSGKNKILLLHKTGETKNGKTNYKISDIAKQSNPNTGSDNSKLFSNVISGKVPKKGVFIISSEALVEYVSHSQLIEISSTLPPASALEQIRQILTKTNSFISFNAIFLKNTTQEKNEAASSGAIRSAQDSITTLNKTEDKTENLLSPSGIINIKKWFKIPKILRSNKNNQSRLAEFSLKDKIFTKKRQSIALKTRISLGRIIKFIANIFFAILNVLRSDKKSTNGKKLLINNFKKLSFKRKILLSIFSIFLILFVYNISSSKIEEKKIQKKENYSKLKDEIKQKQNKAEANLLYSNEEGAKNLFNEIENLISDYPQETEEQIEEFEEYKKILKLNLEKIQKITRIDNLDELTNFQNLNQGANPENIILIPTTSTIYSADSNQKAIYSYDTTNKATTLASNINGQFNNLKSPTKTSGNLIYYFDNTNIIQYSTENNSSILAIELNGNYAESQSMIDIYNDRVYILNTEEGNIHRHNRLTNSFGSAYSWANKNIDLSNSVDISIDGHIYILKKNGELLRLLRGENTNWKLETIEPPLTSTNKLIVSQEFNYIYILEKETSRIVVFDKEGQFITQYTSNSFTNLIDFTIDEENKKLYFLNDSSIYAINATHLEEDEE
jgi:hypothetical protein